MICFDRYLPIYITSILEKYYYVTITALMFMLITFIGSLFSLIQCTETIISSHANLRVAYQDFHVIIFIMSTRLTFNKSLFGLVLNTISNTIIILNL